jgi:beta-lactamase class A
MGMLLEDIYQCAQTGGGTFAAVFQEKVSQTECQMIVSYLSRNKIGNLIEAGVPETTQIAHKHGWVSSNGIINLIGDAAIVYTPGGNYIFVIFLHHPVQLLWDPSAKLIVDLSRAIYNFYNLPTH